MKLLRLSLISLSVLLVATALAAPGFIGPKVEEIWKQQLSRIQGGSATGYERGWFGAEAATEVTGKDGTTLLHSDIQHGPVVFTARGPRVGVVYSETRLAVEQLAPALRAQLEAIYGRLDHSPVVLESFVEANNRVVNTLRLEPFKHSGGNGELEFDGAELVLETDYSGAELVGTIAVGKVQQIRNGREQLYIEPASGSFHFVPGDSAEIALTLPLLRAESESGPLELRDSTLDVGVQLLSARALKVTSDLQLPQVQSATPISAVRQQMTLPQVAAADLLHYLGALIQPAGARNWQQVMARPLKLQQQLAIDSANGPALVDADIDWAGLPAGMRPAKNAPGQWLEPMTGEMTFTAAEQALLQSPLVGQAMALRQYGLLLENDGELQMHLRVNRGELQVNGQLLPADLFMLALTGRF